MFGCQVVSGCRSPLTACAIPFTSPRGCPPHPPPCSPLIAGLGTRYCCGSANFCPACCVSAFRAPHRTHSSLRRSTPAAAADAGSSAFETSIHAHTFPAWVMPATKANATEVRPEHSGPISSVIAPIGNPPCRASSSASMPVEATGRTILAVGVSAAGILAARADSICSRIAEAEGMGNTFALYSPFRLQTASSLAPIRVQTNCK